MLLHDLILGPARSRGGSLALKRGNVSMTYADFANQVERMANGLNALGMGRGERVAVYLNKRTESVVAYFAASLAGGVFVPVNPVLKPAQVGHILRDCAVSVLVTSTAHATALRDEMVDCVGLHHIIVVDDDDCGLHSPGRIQVHTWSGLPSKPCGQQNGSPRIDSDVAAILYTSGSTGSPKGVVLSHRNMVAGAVSVASYLENTSNDVILSVLPLSFDAGFSQLTTAFSVGACVVLMDYLLPQDVPKAIAKFGVTGLTGVPPLWNQLVKLKWPNEATDKLRYIANTGGAMPTATLDSLRQLLPQTKVFLMYGLTEAFRSTYLPPDQLDSRPTSIGKAIPNAEILVVREDGSICDSGEPGELVHRGALVALGYWNDPDRSATRFKPAPNQARELPFPELAVWSGDTVTRDDEGYLYFVGRKDDMIKSSGYRISPTEIEEVIYKSGLVTECAALGIPHPELGQAVVIAACAQVKDEKTSEAIVSACKEALPNFMIPSRIVWHDLLPKNPNGKVDRKKIAIQLKNLYSEHV